MQSHSGIGRKWRRLNRKFGSIAAIGILVLLIIAVVGIIMYALTSMNMRGRW
jgi:hypothetical protein